MGFAVGGMAAYAQEPDNALADLWSQELAHRISGLAAREGRGTRYLCRSSVAGSFDRGRHSVPHRRTPWKYKLSPADKPLPCMGVALNDLLSLFKQHEISIGNDLGSLFSLESDDCKAEADSVAEIDESEENEA